MGVATDFTTVSANEVRLGNWVRFIDFPARYEMKVRVKDLVIMVEHPKMHTFFAIPLTPELLKKCGFDTGLNGYWIKGGVEYNPTMMQLEGFGYCEIKYLHQLQNLYYCLTGQELEINL